MARTKRNRHQLGSDRLEISRLYLRGLTQAEIATRLGVSQPQISYDLRVVRVEWQASAANQLGERLAEETARLDLVEREYWEAWHRSTEGGKDGNSRFLNGILSCVAQRIRLYGLTHYDARALAQAALADTNPPIEDHTKLSDAQLAAMAQILLQDKRDVARDGGTGCKPS